MLRDIRGNQGAADPREGELIDAALDKAAKATALAEAKSKALGFELCKCEFPPIPMLTVGLISSLAAQKGLQGHGDLWARQS